MAEAPLGADLMTQEKMGVDLMGASKVLLISRATQGEPFD